MIPSTNTKLLVTEDWKKVYQSFRNADFKSYDFETLRRTMISYLQENYPENFNDYIDSSEYIALIDLIAYLGQNLSFRIDLNARENFLETAQRRDSILRLAYLISYKPKRNTPAHGFLKITAISTTDNVFDSNGLNLANTTVGWNDPVNAEWYQQFINILNAAMPMSFGNPSDKKVINGINTEQYRINATIQDVPIFSFSKALNGTSMNFELVPCTFSNEDFIYEDAPKPLGPFSFVYKNDNQGSGSINTGFFVHFRQGNLNVTNFTIDNPVPNELIGINTPDINETDVWLWQLDNSGAFYKLWTLLPSTSGNYNVIYNSLNKNIRTLYSVTTRDEDQIDLNFSDGVFGDLPKGEFRLFYRQSNGLTYTIKPEQMTGIAISIPYKNAYGQNHSLTLVLSLQDTVNNSAGPESNLSIQNKAPQSYYLQNRMITGEDYNIAPLAAGPDVLKVKSVNRTSSGISKYYDISDVTGRYSKTDIFGSDGVLYKEEKEESFEFQFTGINQILEVIKNKLAPIISSSELQSFVLDKYSNFSLGSIQDLTWTEVNRTPKQSRGYLSNPLGVYSVGIYTDNTLRYLTADSAVKFAAPNGKYFDKRHNLKTIPTGGIPIGGKPYIWATVSQVIRDGSNNGRGPLDDGTGPIIFNSVVPTSAIPVEIIPRYIRTLDNLLENEISNICLTQRNFGLTFDFINRTWNVILNSNLNIVDEFSLDNQNNVDNINADASWIIAFLWTGKSYKVRYRTLYYVFESLNQTSFYVDKSSTNYDFFNNVLIKDKIDVLSVNTKSTSYESLGADYSWQIDDAIIEADGYVIPNRVKISFYKDDTTDQVLDPETFNNIVDPESLSVETGYKDKFVYFKKSTDLLTYELVQDLDIIAYPTEDEFTLDNPNVDEITDNSLYYFYDSPINAVKYWSTNTASLVYTDEYIGREGRSNLKFHYLHNSSDNRRLDPSKSNLIDIYVLTLSYDTDFRSWLAGNLASEPLSPTSQSLEQSYGNYLNSIKAISDEVIFHPVKYKILFGSRSNINLRARFKAVRNSAVPTTDNDLKTRILQAINNFFSLENWDFGQSFYFSELSTYVMNQLTPDITNFVIVPEGNSNFGSYYEITCQPNELFVSDVSVSEIDIIDSITASELKANLIVTTSGT